MTDLTVKSTETFSDWRVKYNQLVSSVSTPASVGELTALATGITSRTSLVDAINYVYSIRVSEGTPLESSSFTNCSVPETAKLFFGTTDFISYSNKMMNFNDKFFMTDSGKIGFLTSTPSYTFHVVGDIGSETLTMYNSTSGKSVRTYNQSINSVNYNVVDSDATLLINGTTASDTIVGYGGGKLGIGKITSGQMTEMINMRTASTGLGYRMDTPSMSFKFRLDPVGYTISDGDNLRFSIYKDGNVGIGVAVPTYLLHVAGSLYSSTATFGSTISMGSVTLCTISNLGKITISNTSGGKITQGSNTIVDTDDLIPATSIKGLSTDNTSEGNNKYFTSTRAISAINSATISPATVTVSGILNLPTYATASRPTSGIQIGSVIYDTTLGCPIVYAGSSVWKNFIGTDV